jgi:hypothetical protein
MRCDKKTTLEFRILRDYEAPLFKNHNLIYFQNAQPDHIKITDVKFLQWFILVKVMVLLLFLKPIVALL